MADDSFGNAAAAGYVDDDKETVVVDDLTSDETMDGPDPFDEVEYATLYLQDAANEASSDWSEEKALRGATDRCYVLRKERRRPPKPGEDLFRFDNAEKAFLGAGSYGAVFQVPGFPSKVVKFQINMTAVLEDFPKGLPKEEFLEALAPNRRQLHWTKHIVKYIDHTAENAEWEFARHAHALGSGPVIDGHSLFYVDRDVRITTADGVYCKTVNILKSENKFKNKSFRSRKLVSAGTYHEGWVMDRLILWQTCTREVRTAWKQVTETQWNPPEFEHPLALKCCRSIVRLNMPLDLTVSGISHGDIATRNVMTPLPGDEKELPASVYLVDYGRSCYNLPATFSKFFVGQDADEATVKNLRRYIPGGKFEMRCSDGYCVPGDIVRLLSPQPPGSFINAVYSIFGVHPKHMYRVLVSYGLVIDAMSWYLFVRMKRLSFQLFGPQPAEGRRLSEMILAQATKYEEDPVLLAHLKTVEDYLDDMAAKKAKRHERRATDVSMT